jgi:hypothetical protein
MIRKAKAVWRGTGRDGTGHLSTDSGVLTETPYSFRAALKTRGVPILKSSLPLPTPAVSPWLSRLACKPAAIPRLS